MRRTCMPRGQVGGDGKSHGQGGGDGGTQGATEHWRANTALGTDGRGRKMRQHGGVEHDKPEANSSLPMLTARSARGRGTTGGQRGAMRRHHGPR